MKQAFPPRLHVLLAPRARVGLVIRRGPSKKVATYEWELDTGRIRLGQWMKGRIYERRCDLSPDGRHWIGFAMNGHWSSEARGSWTAVARVPWMKALVLLPKGDCWHGGGLFVGPGEYWVNDGYGHAVAHESSEVRRSRSFQPESYYGGECPGVYYNRLQRDGWTIGARERVDGRHGLTRFERGLRHGWTLRKVAHEQVGAPPGRGCYWDEHELVGPGGEVHPRPDWEWADTLGERLAYAWRGGLYTVELRPKGALGEPVLVRDFAQDRFEARAAPY